MKLPGQIEIMNAPDGPAGGGGSEAPSGGGTSGSAPSAPAAPEAASPASPSSPSGAPSTPEALPDDPFSGFGADDSGDDPLPEPTPAAVAPAPVVDPKAPPAPGPAPSEAQPQAPQALQQPGPQEAQAPQLPTPAEPAKMSQHLLANIEAFEKHLATTPEFQLSEADIEAINNDVTTAIPQLLARSYIRAQASALNQMERVVPALIEKFMTVSKARDESQGKFYSRWPQVDRAKHGAIVDRLAKTYRQENPQATLEQMVEALGPYVLMAAGVAPQAGAAPNGNPQAHPASSPMAQPGTRKPPASPFVPAVGGPAAPPQAPDNNPWMGFGAQEEE